MIAALAYASRIWQREDWLKLAQEAVVFILQNLVREDGRLLARYREREALYPGYLDDYANLIWGLLELYLSTLNDEYLRQAEKLAREAIDLFWDEKEGGFYFYGHDSEELLFRPKEIYDHAQPAGNSVMAFNLWRLGALTGEDFWQQLLEQLMLTFAGAINRAPMAATFFLQVYWLVEKTPLKVTLNGRLDEAIRKELWAQLGGHFLPELVLQWNKAEQPLSLQICHQGACLPPARSIAELMSYIENQNPPRC